jgi:hypothetical protein
MDGGVPVRARVVAAILFIYFYRVGRVDRERLCSVVMGLELILAHSPRAQEIAKSAILFMSRQLLLPHTHSVSLTVYQSNAPRTAPQARALYVRA